MNACVDSNLVDLTGTTSEEDDEEDDISLVLHTTAPTFSEPAWLGRARYVCPVSVYCSSQPTFLMAAAPELTASWPLLTARRLVPSSSFLSFFFDKHPQGSGACAREKCRGGGRLFIGSFKPSLCSREVVGQGPTAAGSGARPPQHKR